MKDKNKKMILVVGCLLVVIAATFAFFVAQIGNGASSNVNVEANSVDDLKFEVDKDISLSIDQFNFASGSGNLSDQAVAKASLKANNTKKTATYNYYVYFNVTSNNYVYTTSDSKPEIVLTITNPNGSEVTSLNGLSYVSATNGDGTVVKGFDITTYKGMIKVAENYEISSNSSTNYTNQEWTFKVTFINLDSDQYDNSEGKMVGEILIQKEKIKTLADICSGKSLSDCVKTQYTGTQGDNNMYLHDSTLENGANDGSYRYAGSSDTTNNFVCFGYDSQDGTCPTDYLYRIIGVFDNQVKLIKYDYATSSLLGTDGGYDDTLENILVDEKFKNIYLNNYKGNNALSEISQYYWNNTNINGWSESTLNTINLNVNFLANIGAVWSNKIDNHTWIVGGNTDEKILESQLPNIYINEITSPATNVTYEAKVGLMYISDYGYAADQNAWTNSIVVNDDNNSTTADIIIKNWLYIGVSDATITGFGETKYYALDSNDDGSSVGFYYYKVGRDSSCIRPTFYLNSNVKYQSGDGTKNKPIILES